MKSFFNSEKGEATIVEATMLLPFCVIIIAALYYASVFLCQKAILQANLENALIYYKNIETDSYVTAPDHVSYFNQQISSTYQYNGVTQPLYRNFVMNFDEDEFKDFFQGLCGNMFFDNGKNVTVSLETVTNTPIYKTLKASATQIVSPAVSLEMVGIDNTLVIEVEAMVAVTNPDEFLRTSDLVVDIIGSLDIMGKIDEGICKKIIKKGLKFLDDFQFVLVK